MTTPHVTYLVPNAHIDVAWLWEIRETREEVVPNTFRDVLDVMDADPALTYTQSQALFYVWLERDHPDLLARIKHYVQQGRWEPSGGAWVEPDANLPCGESLVRQHLHGQRTFLRLFGRTARVAWLPDTFGFNGNLPQILAHCGIDAFYTAKMLFNLYCRSLDAPPGRRFEPQAFQWEGIDGTRVLAYCSPLFYNTVLSPRALADHRRDRDDSLPLSLLPFGRGDHGGGPTAEELAVAADDQADLRAKGVDERLEVSTAEGFFEALRAHEADLPVHAGELYLENHRGCATTEGRIKRANRVLGHRLTSLEKLLCGRRIMGLSDAPYPTQRLREAWEIYLTNQFHDILCGSSIPPVHTEAVADYARLESHLDSILWNELGRPRQRFALMAFNPLSWPRHGWTTLPQAAGSEAHPGWQRSALEGEDGQVLLPLPEVAGLAAIQLSVDLAAAPPTARGTPARGWLEESTQGAGLVLLENEHLRVAVSTATGNLVSVVRKSANEEVLDGEGNRLELLSDAKDVARLRHQFSAWNVAYEPEVEPVDDVERVGLVESGPFRAAARIERRVSRSRLIQEVFLVSGDPVLHCRLQVDWQETYRMLKVCFPVRVAASNATYEIPFGAISRPTHDATPEAAAKFENAAWQWIDLSAEEGRSGGAALLNTGKQGGDVRGNRLRSTLLRSSMFPAPDCDKGRHRISWGFFPHEGDWRRAEVVHQAYAFNVPLVVARGGAEGFRAPLSVSPKRVVISALKRSEEDDAWILRLYESSGRPARVEVRFAEPPRAVERVDGLELGGERLDCSEGAARLELGPYQVATLRFSVESDG